jgi:response regulator NasT
MISPASDAAPVPLLVVEDDAVARTALDATLARHGFAVMAMETGEGALALSEAILPSIALVDIHLPGLSGVEVVRALAARSVACVVLSSQDDDAVVEAAIAAGALGYLVKPLEPRRVLPALRAALERASEMRALRETGERLEDALATDRETSTALGVLMERHGLSRGEAFERLRSTARRERRKVHDVARAFLAGRQAL